MALGLREGIEGPRPECHFPGSCMVSANIWADARGAVPSLARRRIILIAPRRVNSEFSPKNHFAIRA
jgi:hypothetical protein